MSEREEETKTKKRMRERESSRESEKDLLATENFPSREWNLERGGEKKRGEPGERRRAPLATEIISVARKEERERENGERRKIFLSPFRTHACARKNEKREEKKRGEGEIRRKASPLPYERTHALGREGEK